MKSGDLCSLHSPLFTLLLRVLHAQKILLFDIDGTLSTGLTTMMPESAVKALAQLRANGHFTAIATGRLQESAAAVAARYGFTDIVADGGWSVTHNGEIVEMGRCFGGRLHCAARAARTGRYSVGGVAGE